MILFTSDTHYGHTKMAEHRGFADRDAMDEALVKAWNSVVDFGDTVYHLGDLSFRKPAETAEILAQLRGTIHLVPGNHDKPWLRQIKKVQGWLESIKMAQKLIVCDRLHTLKAVYGGEEHRFELCHFPMLTWDRAHHGALHLHGHSHGQCRYPDPNTTMLDVGVDSVGLEPIALPMVLERMKARRYSPCDRHAASTVAAPYNQPVPSVSAD